MRNEIGRTSAVQAVLDQVVTLEHILSCENSYEAFLLARDKLKGPVTAKDVIAVAHKHPRAAWVMAMRVKLGKVTPEDVIACPDSKVAYALADKVTRATAADAIACQHEDAATRLAYVVRDVKLDDVIACPHEGAASYWAKWYVNEKVSAAHVVAAKTSRAALHLAYRVPYGTVTIEDVLACRHPAAAAILFERMSSVGTTEERKEQGSRRRKGKNKET